uniref:SURF1-like protein n=1 Tax=Anthurium amnicola TaxID=1678845 RepID=A0A1D1Y3Y4_9ARAE
MAASLSKALRLRKLFLAASGNGNPAPALHFRAFSSSEGALSELPPPPPPPHTSASAAKSLSAEKERGNWSKLLLFIPGAVTFGLGTWQIIRRQEKIEMIEHRKKRLEMKPIIWGKVSSVDEGLDCLEFRKVECEGVFDESKTIYLGPRSRSISGVTENGYYVITPLIPVSSEPNSVQLPILVNRGWVPRDWRNKTLQDQQDREMPSNQTADAGEQGGSWWKFWAKKPKADKNQELAVSPIKVLGVIRGSEKPSIFVPANNPDSGQWFYVDVPKIARTVGLPDNIMYIEDINENISASNPYPVPKDVNTLIRHSVMPQDHLNYTLTWYSLSAAVTFMAVKRIRPSKSRR